MVKECLSSILCSCRPCLLPSNVLLGCYFLLLLFAKAYDVHTALTRYAKVLIFLSGMRLFRLFLLLSSVCFLLVIPIAFSQTYLHP